jgi:hypothetical protein
MDEHGIALGVCMNTQVLTSSKKTYTYVKSPEDCKWVLILKAVSATSHKIRPVIIFKGQSLQV